MQSVIRWQCWRFTAVVGRRRTVYIVRRWCWLSVPGPSAVATVVASFRIQSARRMKTSVSKSRRMRGEAVVIRSGISSSEYSQFFVL